MTAPDQHHDPDEGAAGQARSLGDHASISTSTPSTHAVPSPHQLAAALVRTWQDIRAHHAEVPAAVVLIAPHRPRNGAKSVLLGHCRHYGWELAPPPTPDPFKPLTASTQVLEDALQRRDSDALHAALVASAEATAAAIRSVASYRSLPEILIVEDHAHRGSLHLLGTMLHEAAHTIAQRRLIKDTSRQGRYHNSRFKALANELGLTGDRTPQRGWSIGDVPEATRVLYAAAIADLDLALAGRRTTDDAAAAAVARGPRCDCGQWIAPSRRRRRLVPSAGAVICSVCDATPADRSAPPSL